MPNVLMSLYNDMETKELCPYRSQYPVPYYAKGPYVIVQRYRSYGVPVDPNILPQTIRTKHRLRSKETYESKQNINFTTCKQKKLHI